MLANIRGFRFIDVSLPQKGSVLCCLPTPAFLPPLPPPPAEDAAEYSAKWGTNANANGRQGQGWVGEGRGEERKGEAEQAANSQLAHTHFWDTKLAR